MSRKRGLWLAIGVVSLALVIPVPQVDVRHVRVHGPVPIFTSLNDGSYRSINIADIGCNPTEAQRQQARSTGKRYFVCVIK